ncbi:MAG: NUDIX domain-containing protein [bacterium]
MKTIKHVAIGTEVMIPVSGEHVDLVLSSPLFQRWTKSISRSLKVKSILIQSADVIRREGREYVLFIKLQAEIFSSEGRKLPGVIFLRGDAVGILVVLEDENKQSHIVLVKGSMPALGDAFYLQMPAGMTDGQNNIRAVAIREGKEETGINFEDGGELFNLGNLLCLPGANRGLLGLSASPGACDEKIHLFVYRKKVSRDFINSLDGRITGLPGDLEHLKLKVIRFEDLPLETYDMKTLLAYFMYGQALHRGLL